jgi:hypothetical protein
MQDTGFETFFATRVAFKRFNESAATEIVRYDSAISGDLRSRLGPAEAQNGHLCYQPQITVVTADDPQSVHDIVRIGKKSGQEGISGSKPSCLRNSIWSQ